MHLWQRLNTFFLLMTTFLLIPTAVATTDPAPSPEEQGCPLDHGPLLNIPAEPTARISHEGPDNLKLCFSWVMDGRWNDSAPERAEISGINPYREVLERLGRDIHPSNTSRQTPTCGTDDNFNIHMRRLLSQYEKVLQCIVTFNLLDPKDLQHDEMSTTQRLERRGQANPAQAMAGQGDPQQQMLAMAQQMGQSEIVCRGNGVMTRDYRKCVHIINTLQGVSLAEVALNSGEQLAYDHRMSSKEHELMTSDDPHNPVNALEMQRSAVEGARDIAARRATFQGTKGGIIWALASQLPSRRDIIDECADNRNISRAVEEAQQSFLALFNNHIRFKEDLRANGPMQDIINRTQAHARQITQAYSAQGQRQGCQKVVNGFVTQVVMNESAKEVTTQTLISAFTQMGIDSAQAILLDRQANRIGDAIQRVDDFEPEEYMPNFDDMRTSFCNYNPAHPDCLEGQGPRNVGGYETNFSMGSGGATTGPGSVNEFDAPEGSRQGAQRDATRRDPASRVGSRIANIDRPSGFESAPPGAGRAQYGGGHTGGGGGGGPAGVSAPGGGGAAGGTAAPAGGQRPGSVGDGVNYQGGSDFSGGGGLGRTQRRDDRSDNPFAQLLGQDNQRAGGEELNFRGPAQMGGANNSIFQMISNRYQNVSQQENRLMEYERK